MQGEVFPFCFYRLLTVFCFSSYNQPITRNTLAGSLHLAHHQLLSAGKNNQSIDISLESPTPSLLFH